MTHKIMTALALALALLALALIVAGRLDATPPEVTPGPREARSPIRPPVVEQELSATVLYPMPEQYRPKYARPVKSLPENRAEIAQELREIREYKFTSKKENAELEAEISTEEEPTMTYAGRFTVCGYDTCVQCCGWSAGITASGTAATVGRTVASNDFPFGTELYIDGLGYRTVEDRGGMARGVLDVLCSDHAECYAITGSYDVYIVEGK